MGEKMKLRIISDYDYEQYVDDKRGISLQMQTAMIGVYRNNGWKCVPVGLYTTVEVTDFTGSFDSVSSDVAITTSEKLIGVAVLCGKPMKLAGMNYTCQYGPYLESYDREVVEAFFTQVLTVLRTLKCTSFSINPNCYRANYDLRGNITQEFMVLDESLITDCGYTKRDMEIDTEGKIDMRYMFKKDLNYKTAEELRASYLAKTNRELKNAERNLVEIENLDFEQIEQFTELMQMSGDKHGFRVHGSDYYRKLKEEFGANALFLIAKLNCDKFISQMELELAANERLIASFEGDNRKGRITRVEEINSRIAKMIKLVQTSTDIKDGYLYLSAGVYIQTNDQLIHFLSGNDSRYGKFNSSTLMQDYAMQYALSQNLPVFNMYGVAGTFAKSDSVYMFKVGFGGYVSEYVGTFDYQLAPIRLKISSFVKRIIRKN